MKKKLVVGIKRVEEKDDESGGVGRDFEGEDMEDRDVEERADEGDFKRHAGGRPDDYQGRHEGR